MGGAAICVWGCCGLSCALLLQMVAAFMAPNTKNEEKREKERKNGKEFA